MNIPNAPAALFSAAAALLRSSACAQSLRVPRAGGFPNCLANRNCILLARQAGLYKDDKLCQKMHLTSSHENPVVRKIYSDLAASPMDDKMYGLLHTHFSPRSMLALHH